MNASKEKAIAADLTDIANASDNAPPTSKGKAPATTIEDENDAEEDEDSVFASGIPTPAPCSGKDVQILTPSRKLPVPSTRSSACPSQAPRRTRSSLLRWSGSGSRLLRECTRSARLSGNHPIKFLTSDY